MFFEPHVMSTPIKLLDSLGILVLRQTSTHLSAFGLLNSKQTVGSISVMTITGIGNMCGTLCSSTKATCSAKAAFKIVSASNGTKACVQYI